ncbi:MAG: FG-GAP-like repeat-containing protein [Candidatus Helarchaeota archaeon]
MKFKRNRLYGLILEVLIITSLFFGMLYFLSPTFYNSSNSVTNNNNFVSAENKLSQWENYSMWRYRINITLKNPLSVDVENIPIEFYSNFSQYNCLNNSLRLFKGLPPSSEEVPSQVWNISYFSGTNFISGATITFLVNLTAGQKVNYYLYYSNDSDLTTDAIDSFNAPNYQDKISTNFNSSFAQIENSKYYIEFSKGKGIYNYTLKSWDENIHSTYSLSPQSYELLSKNTQYVLVRPGEYLLFIAYEDNTNITLYDAKSGVRLDKSGLPGCSEISSRIIDTYDTWRYPSQTISFSQNMIIKIEYTKTASLMVTSLGVNRIPGEGGVTNNYYSGTDSLSDDAIYSAYGTDLLLWIPRDCWIAAYQPHTKVTITDINTDGDNDDSKTLMLGTGSNWWKNIVWNTTRDPLVYTANRSTPGNYYDYTPYGDPSGDDYLNPNIFDNDIVHIQANSSITVIAGRPANDYQTEVYGKNQMQFYFPIMVRFRVTATDDNTRIYWRNLTHGMADLDDSYGGYDPGDIYSYQGSYPDYTDYIANVYVTYFSDYSSRHQLSDAEVAQGYINLDKGDTIEFYSWPPDYVVNYGTPYAARAEDPHQSTYHTIYDRWNSAPDFYKDNWANITSTKPIKVWVGTFQSSSNVGEASQKFGSLQYYSSSYQNQYILLGSIENDTIVTLDSSEGVTDQHTTIVKASDLNGDGTDEIIVGSTIIGVYNGTNGEKLWEYPVWATFGGGMERFGWDDWRWVSQIYTEDMNGDGYKDIIISGADATFNILVLNGKTGKPLWYRADTSYYALDLAFGDINGDGISDIVYVEGPGYGYACYALDGKTGNYLWRHYMGYLGWAFEVELMDINSDGLYDMLVFGLTNDYIYTYNVSKLINTSYWSASGGLPGYNTPGWRRVIFDDNRPQYDEDGGWYDRVTMNQILQSRMPGANGYDLRVLKVGDFNSSLQGPEIAIGTGRANYYNGNYTFIAVVNYTLSNIYQNGRIGNEYQSPLGGKAIWVTSINPYKPQTTTYDYHWVRKMAVDDLNGDNSDDLIVGLGEYESSWNSHQEYEGNITLYAYSGTTGELLWKSDNITDNIWDIKTYDYNSDGQLDVLVSVRGERNNYKPWYIYNGYSGNITLVNGSNGKIIWYKNIADGSGYRWVRSVCAGNLSSGSTLDLIAGTYSNNESFYVYLYNGTTWNRANWKSQILPTKSFKDNLNLSKGEVVRIVVNNYYRGIIINSTKPIIVVKYAGGTTSYESITWLPLQKRNNIISINKVNEGPIFVQYQIEWSDFKGLYTTDLLTFYASTSLWKLKRTQYWSSSYTSDYTIINSLYNISTAHQFNVSLLDLMTDVNEANFDGHHDLTLGIVSTGYSTVVDSIQNKNNISFGLYLTNYKASQYVSLSGISFDSQYKLCSEYIEFKAIANGYSTPGGSPNSLSLDLWEFAGVNKTKSQLTNIDNILNTNFIQSESSDTIWYSISIRVVDSANIPVGGANVTIYNKTLYDLNGPVPSAKVASEIVDSTGYTKTFTKILEGNYTIVAKLSSDQYLAYNGPEINSTVNFEVNATNKNLQIKLNVVSLNIKALYKSKLTSLDSIPPDDFFINAKISIYNSSMGESIVNQTTDYNGEATFYLIPSDLGEWNYTIKVFAYGEAFDLDIVKRVSQGFYNYTSSGTWESPLILIGKEVGGTASNMNKLDNLTYNVSTEENTNTTQIEFNFNLSSINAPVDLINLTYRGKINDTASVGASLKLYNFLSSTWDEVYDINQNNTWMTFKDQFSNDYVDSSSDNLVRARLDIESNTPILSMIDYIGCEYITLTGNNPQKEYNISLSSPINLIINCTGRAPIYTYLNVAPPNVSQSIYILNYSDTFSLRLFFNASENYQNGIPDSNTEIIAQIKEPITDNILATYSKSNGGIIYNGTQGYYNLNFSTINLNTGDYNVYINATYPGYTPAELSFILRILPLTTSLQVSQNGNPITKISIYWNSTMELNVTYLYSQNKLSGWTLSWQILQYSSIKGSVLVSNDRYELSISSEQLDTTTYTLQLEANKTNYDSVQLTITIEVHEIPTKLNGTDFQYPSIKVYAMEKKLIYFELLNNLTNTGVDGAITSYTIDTLKETGSLNNTGNGIYVLDLSTENKPVGSYAIVVHIKKNKFSEVPCVVFLEIMKRPTKLKLLTPQSVEVSVGESVSFEFNLTDELNGIGLNFTINYSWTYGSGTLQLIGNGIYRLTIPTDNIARGTYPITITCSTDNWTVQSITITLSITWVKIMGIELPYFIALIVAVASAVAIFSLYIAVKRARIPETVRKIDSTINAIKKKKGELSIPISKSKSVLYSERFKNDWAILKLTPPTIQNKYLIDYISDLISKVKSIKMSLPEIEKLVNKIQLLGTTEIRVTLENMGFPPETIELILNAIKNYGTAA